MQAWFNMAAIQYNQSNAGLSYPGENRSRDLGHHSVFSTIDEVSGMTVDTPYWCCSASYPCFDCLSNIDSQWLAAVRALQCGVNSSVPAASAALHANAPVNSMDNICLKVCTWNTNGLCCLMTCVDKFRQKASMVDRLCRDCDCVFLQETHDDNATFGRVHYTLQFRKLG